MAVQEHIPKEVRFEQKCGGGREEVAEFCCFNVASVGFASGLDPGGERSQLASRLGGPEGWKYHLPN